MILFACKYAQEALVHSLIWRTFVECAQSWYHRMLVNIHCRSFYIMSFESEYSRCTDAVLRCRADISGIKLLCTTYSFFLSKVSTQSFLSYIYIYDSMSKGAKSHTYYTNLFITYYYVLGPIFVCGFKTEGLKSAWERNLKEACKYKRTRSESDGANLTKSSCILTLRDGAGTEVYIVVISTENKHIFGLMVLFLN